MYGRICRPPTKSSHIQLVRVQVKMMTAEATATALHTHAHVQDQQQHHHNVHTAATLTPTTAPAQARSPADAAAAEPQPQTATTADNSVGLVPLPALPDSKIRKTPTQAADAQLQAKTDHNKSIRSVSLGQGKEKNIHVLNPTTEIAPAREQGRGRGVADDARAVPAFTRHPRAATQAIRMTLQNLHHNAPSTAHTMETVVSREMRGLSKLNGP
ncbi:hypothetical protein [Alishewanella longhuensis]